MQIDLCRRVDGDIHVLIFNDISPDDGAGDGRAAEAAVEVDACRAGSGCVADIGSVAGDVIGEDDVVVEVVGRGAEVGADVTVKGYSWDAVVLELIVDDEVSRDFADSAAGLESG